MGFLQQGIEPEGFPLLLQSLKTDGPIKEMHSNPNKKLYGGKLSSYLERCLKHLQDKIQKGSITAHTFSAEL